MTQRNEQIHISSKALIERAGVRFFPKENPFTPKSGEEGHDPNDMDLSHVNTEKATTPFPQGAKVDLADQPKDNEPKLDKPFRELLGVISFVAITTRVDIAWHTSQLGRIQSNPGRTHWDLAKHVLRYLIRTKDYGLCYSKSDQNVEYYTDASKYTEDPNLYRRIPQKHTSATEPEHKYVQVKGRKYIDPSDPDGRRSSFGYVAIYGDAPVNWQSSIQKGRRALSTTESELYAATLAAKDLLHLRGTLRSMGDACADPITMHEDNQSCINQILRAGITARNKHIEMRWYYLRDLETEGATSIQYCPTELQLADILTKNLPQATFLGLRNQLICPPPE
jgi:hypothetical protein